MKAEEKTRICDSCKDRVAGKKCFICEKDVCYNCENIPLFRNKEDLLNIEIQFIKGDKTKNLDTPTFCLGCKNKVAENNIDSETLSIFLKNNLITDKI